MGYSLHRSLRRIAGFFFARTAGTRRRYIRPVLAVFLWLSLSGSLSAQYVVDNWTSRNGLSSNSVNSITQTKDGYLWLATFNGLIRFDGASFTFFNSFNTPGMVTNRTSRVFEDSRGRLWVGTETDQVTVIRQDSSFHLGQEPGLGTGQITDISEDNNGTVWIGSLNGLFRWDEENRRFHPFRNHNTVGPISQLYPEPAVYRHYDEQAVFQLYKDDEGMIWVVSPSRIWPLTEVCRNGDPAGCRNIARLVPDGAIAVNLSEWDEGFPSGSGTAQGQPAGKSGSEVKGTELLADLSEGPEDVPYFSSMVRSSGGSWWIGTSNGAIRYADGEATIFTGKSLSNGSINDLFIDSEQRVWIATQQGLQVVEHGETAPGEPLPEFANSAITRIHEDHEGSIWAGTTSSGLKRIKSTPFQVIGEPEGLTSDVILSVHEDSDENLWVGTNCFGFNKIEPSADRYAPSSQGSENSPGSTSSRLTSEISGGTITRFWQNTGWRNGCVWTLATTRDGTLWIGEWGGGLSMMRPGEEIRRAPFNDRLQSKIISALYQDRQGALWIGTRNGGVYRWFRNELTHYGTADGLSHSTITYIFQSGDGAMWFSTHNGVTRYHHGNFLQIRREDGLSHDQVRMLMEPSPGMIWAGTYGGGINQIELVSEDSVTVQTLDTRRGLFDDIVSQIFEDDYGRVWLGGNKGISHLPKQMLTETFNGKRGYVEVTSYGFEEGMRSNETNGGFQPSGWKTRQGNLLFPTVNGLVIADPSRIRENSFPPQVVVEQVQAGETAFPADSAVTLAAGANDFEIKYTAFSFLNPDKMEFEYRLEGFDSDWRTAGNRRTAFFTNVPPGDYIFRVRASNNDGVWNREGTAVAIFVAPFFFQTRWFFGFCLLVLAGFIAGGYKWRIRHMKRREKALGNTVKQQTAVLAKQNQQLKEMDRVKSRFFANISHEFRTPLTLILGPLEELLRKKKHNNIHRDLSLMQRNGIRLQRLIDQVLALVKLESENVKPDLREFDLQTHTFNIAELFRPLAERQGLELTVSSAEADGKPGSPVRNHFMIIADKDKVELILANLLSNAIKFTAEGGRIEVGLVSAPDRVIVTVADTGKGISTENRDQIFNRFYQVEDAENRSAEGMGIGLALCREFMTLLQGTISVESEPGEGSTFTLEFLKGRDHLREAGMDLSSAGQSSSDSSPVTDEVLDTGREWITPPAGDLADDVNSSVEKPWKHSRDHTTLLIVEDHRDMQEYLRTVLAEDYKILEASNGEDGLKQVQKNLPDLIIADIMMPVMDGLAFSRSLRESPLHRNIPLLFLTARADDTDQIEALQQGGNDYLTKPFNPDVLRARIMSLLASQQRLREQLLTEAFVENNPPANGDGRSLNGPQTSQPGDWSAVLARRMGRNASDPDFGIDQLAELMHMSRSQLHRKTKKSTGRTPVQLLRETRLKKARQLIEAGKSNYSEIAYACGFNSLSYFSRSYKKHFGVAPSTSG